MDNVAVTQCVKHLLTHTPIAASIIDALAPPCTHLMTPQTKLPSEQPPFRAFKLN